MKRVMLSSDDNEARYYLVPDSILSVKDGQKVSAGAIARLPKETTKTKDITGGLPRVAEHLRQEKLRIVLLLQKMMAKLFLEKRLEENKEFQ